MAHERDGNQTFRGFRLDPFQIQAIEAIREGRSVLVSAPTGVGKTLVADYLIQDCCDRGKEVIYTAPIKALSNQKYKQFKEEFGVERVGIITGDVVINSRAPIRLMTTEIFRNMLHAGSEDLEHVSHVIFDEVHYISDESRGSVWEEAIILMPPGMKILGLSATIPNVNELAAWMESVRQEPVEVIRHEKRAVPLVHWVYEKRLGLISPDRMAKEQTHFTQEEEEVPRRRARGASHLEVVDALAGQYLPALYFVFSRKQCQIKAHELAEKEQFLSPREVGIIEAFFDEKVSEKDLAHIPSVQSLRRILLRGVGYHHAGLLPVLKEIVEELFSRRLIHVLYCTETFAVGINMPVKTAVFDSIEKFNGVDFRPMTVQEYYQMAGRAGRRGIDEKGYVVTRTSMDEFDPELFGRLKKNRLEDLHSQFQVSYNTILNLLDQYKEEEIRRILEGSFANYQQRQEQLRIRTALTECQERQKQLLSLGCEHLGGQGCPVDYISLNQEKKRLERLLERLKGRGRAKSGHYRRTARKLRTILDGLENLDPQKCTPQAIEQCGEYSRELRRLRKQEEAFKEELEKVAAEGEYWLEFTRRRKVLEELNFLSGETLLARGQMAKDLHVQELLVSELIAAGLFHQWDPDEINAVVVGIDFDRRRGPQRPYRQDYVDLDVVRRIADDLRRQEKAHLGHTQVLFDPYLSGLAFLWSAGASFMDLLRRAKIDEGDIVASFRRSIDLLRQIRAAVRGDEALVEKLNEAIRRMDRDVVEVKL